MWYAVISTDVENSLEARLKIREAHLARLQVLLDEDRVMVAGPHPAIDSENPGDAGFSGSLVIVDFPSLQDARKWASDDPYIAAGVSQASVVKPFKQVLP